MLRQNHSLKHPLNCRKTVICEGQPWYHNRIYRVYQAVGLHLRRPAKNRLSKRERAPIYAPRFPGRAWSADDVNV